MTQVERGLDKIKRAGLRVTRARRAILETITSSPHPATITEIATRTNVDTTTVYRNMTPLVAAAVLEEINTDGASRFALADDHHHDHLTCTRCGYITHIPCSLGTTPTLAHERFASITHHAVTYYGLCNICARSASLS